MRYGTEELFRARRVCPPKVTTATDPAMQTWVNNVVLDWKHWFRILEGGSTVAYLECHWQRIVKR